MGGPSEPAVVRQILESGDPVLEYKARLLLLEEPEGSARLKRLRQAIGASPRALALLAGWNCDKRPQARTSSVIETLIPLRGLSLAASRYADREAARAAARAAEFFLQRGLFRRLRDGRPIREDFFRIHYPVQFYDLLFALTVMAETGRLADPRCGEALRLLAARQRPDGGFALEECNAVTSSRLVTRGSRVDWGPRGKSRTNPLVSIEALRVLKEAGRAAG